MAVLTSNEAATSDHAAMASEVQREKAHFYHHEINEKNSRRCSNPLHYQRLIAVSFCGFKTFIKNTYLLINFS
ncbi:Uncharacterised protein [Yersinia aldovae]|uniref:Uncharacterized protein n=1 Tax=Yersinia aldovae TaxID=29483 RepID=A0A0T9T700_YERAL|nr:Uncharacterised protein [Yersinia aldovae]